MKTPELIHIGCAREVFHDKVIFFTWAVPQVTIKVGALRRRVRTMFRTEKK